MKQTSIFYNISLLILLLFSFFLYLHNNTAVPPSLFSDEVDVSYQAFVFNTRESDYFGNKFPVHFHSYSDWRTSLYIYSVALTQRIFGHNDFSVRLPSAIYTVLSVYVFYLIINIIFNQKSWALIGALIFSITPWLFIYSRSAFEATGMILFLLLGTYFWIKYLRLQKDNYLFASVFFFITTMYFYSTAKLFLIFIAFSILILWFKKLIGLSIKSKIILILLVTTMSLPFLTDLYKGRAGYRFSYINIFSDPTVSKNVDYLRYEDSVVLHGQQIGLTPSLLSKVFHNKIALWGHTFITNYFSSFSTDFLFLKGDGNLRQGIQSSGNLLYPDFFLIILGISFVFYKKSSNRKIYLFFLINLLLAPISFALTRDSAFPHATRLILMLPFFIFFSTLGLKKLYQLSKSKVLIVVILFIYLLSFSRFIHQYYYHYPNISARDWHYGMKEAVVKSLEYNYSKIYYINSYEPFTPFFLNYSNYLPSDINKSPAEALHWDNNQYFTGMQAEDKYYIGNIEWPYLFKEMPKDTLYVLPQREVHKLKLQLEEYNQSGINLKVNFLYQTEKKYIEQEVIYLITLTK